MKGRSSAEIYHGNTEDEAPYVVTQLKEFKNASRASAPQADATELRCNELSRNSREFLDRIENQGVTLYDEQQNPVWFTRNPEDVLHALGVTGQRHFGPIVGGPGPRF